MDLAKSKLFLLASCQSCVWWEILTLLCTLFPALAASPLLLQLIVVDFAWFCTHQACYERKVRRLIKLFKHNVLLSRVVCFITACLKNWYPRSKTRIRWLNLCIWCSKIWSGINQNWQGRIENRDTKLQLLLLPVVMSALKVLRINF